MELHCFDALVIDLEEVAVFSCDMTSLGKQINMMMMMMMMMNIFAYAAPK